MTRRVGRGLVDIVSGILLQSVAAAATITPAAALAEEQQLEFTLPAQPLAAALMEYGRQAGVAIAAPEALTSSKISAVVEGRYARETALRALLKGTGLRYRFLSSGGVRIEAARSNSAPRIQIEPTVQQPVNDAGNGDTEEILVTARRREERQIDVPGAVTALDSAQLDDIGFTNLKDLAEYVPSLSLARPQNGASGALYVFIRGIGQASPDNVSRDPGVGIYLDDVYLARGTASSVDMGDIERVEVLRGPQGTLYGRNAVGGAVKYITAKPTGRFDINESLDVGNFGRWRTLTSLNLPESNSFSTKLTYMRSGYDGWASNPGTGGDFGTRDQEGFRTAVRWRGGEGMTADYVYDRNTQHGTPSMSQHGYGASTIIGLPTTPGRIDRPYRPVDWPLADDYETSGHALTFDLPVTQSIDVKSITSYRDLQTRVSTDTVEAYVFSGFGLNASADYSTRQHQFSQELLLDAANGSVKYSVGAFYFSESADKLDGSATAFFATPTAIVPLTPLDSEFTTTSAVNSSVGVYGNLTWTPPVLDGRLDISAGGRYSTDERKATGGTVGRSTQTADSSSFDPSLTLSWHWTDSLHLYAKYSTAYRAGGFNTANDFLVAFDPERLRSYEIGMKSSERQDRLRLEVAAFVQNYDNIQVDENVFSETPPNYRVATTNAGAARIRGIEGEVGVKPVRDLELRAQFAYLEGESLAAVPVTLPFLPKWKYNLAAEYAWELISLGRLSTSIGWSYSGATIDYQTFTDSPRPSYGLLNARITLADIAVGAGQAAISLWGKNLADRDYQESHVSGGVSIGEPRAYGLTLNYRYW